MMSKYTDTYPPPPPPDPHVLKSILFNTRFAVFSVINEPSASCVVAHFRYIYKIVNDNVNMVLWVNVISYDSQI